VVLWEMLTGRPLFQAETLGDTLAAVLTREIDWSRLPSATPPNVVRVLRRCLERDPARRVRDAGDVRLELAQVEPASSQAVGPSGGVSWLTLARWIAATALVLSLVVVWVLRRPAPVAPSTPLKLTVQVSPGDALATRLGANILISPDGKTLVYGTSGSSQAEVGIRRLMVQRLDGSAPATLPGVDNAVAPFFSPDGQWIGYFAADSLMKVGLHGGAAVPVARNTVGGARGGSWARDGTIVFAPGFASGLWRVPADGGTPTPLTQLDAAREERSHRWPSFLPSGKAVLFMTQRVGEDYDNADIEAVSLADGKRTVLVRGGSFPRYAPGGWLLYTRQNTLFATRFDPDTLEVGREPARPVIDNLLTWAGDQESGDGSAEYAIADNGTLVYRTSNAAPVDTGSTFVWVDSKGQVTPAFTETFRALSLEISPDGRTIAIDGRSESGLGIWLRDLERGSVAPLTSVRGGETQSAWSPDGRSLAYGMRQSGSTRTIRIRAMVGGGAERTIPSAHLASGPTSWSRDGRTLFVDDHDETTRDDVWAIDVAGGSGARPVIRAPGAQAGTRVSPDGRWLLYFSDESGTQHVYVQPIDAERPRWQVSTDRGTQPRWSRDGRRIYYVRGAPPDVPSSAVPEAGRILAVDVSVSGEGLRFSTPREIYQGSPLMGAPERPVFDVHPDGRLLVIRRQARDEPSDRTHAVVALGWAASLGTGAAQ
jgi:serine/threonine-protein kinase